MPKGVVGGDSCIGRRSVGTRCYQVDATRGRRTQKPAEKDNKPMYGLNTT